MRFDTHDKVVCAGFEHRALPGIHREEGNIDVFAADGGYDLAEFGIRLLNILHGGFLPPVPEIQVSGMEDAQAVEIDKKTDAQVGGVKCGDFHARER